jgi:hypothetical protein
LNLLCSARLDVPEDGPELAPQAGLHQHVQVFPVLEGLEQLHDELGVGLLHNFLGKMWRKELNRCRREGGGGPILKRNEICCSYLYNYKFISFLNSSFFFNSSFEN